MPADRQPWKPSPRIWEKLARQERMRKARLQAAAPTAAGADAMDAAATAYDDQRLAERLAALAFTSEPAAALDASAAQPGGARNTIARDTRFFSQGPPRLPHDEVGRAARQSVDQTLCMPLATLAAGSCEIAWGTM